MIMQDMDFKSIIFHSARDGKLDRLKVFLDHRSKDEVLMLVDAKTNGATPLVMACRNGHYDVAQYLIELCNADLEQTGSVVFDGETIEGAPPLWCAAAAGHMSIVRLLVRHNARVNSTTRTNSTPLRAACFDGHFEIVKYLVDHGADIEVANRHGHTCLMIACYKGHYRIAKYLLKLNANVNRKSVKGNTSLHDCAESGSLEILKLLIEHNAKMDVDSYGMTPLLAASVTGHSHIVEYLIQCTGLVSKAERIDALELLGATYIDKKRDMIGGLDLWKRAMEDRYEGGTNTYMKPLQTKFVPAYDNMKEIRDLEGLEDLLADPDEMRMQALAVRERILGPAHPDTSYYIRYRGAVYADAGKFHRCISLWTYALDMQQSMLDPLNPMTQSSLFSFTELFSFMMGEQGRPTTRSRRVPPASYEDMLSIFIKAINEVEAGAKLISELPVEDRDITYLHRVLVISLHLACLLVRVLPTVSEEKKFEAYKTVYRLVKLGVRGQRGQTVLHLVASRDAAGPVGRYPVCEFPAPELAAVLMATGADATAVDDEGNTPLHTAVKSHPCPPILARTLLDNGAHLDTVNKEGLTFKDLLKGQALSEIVNPLHYTTLGCLAAKVIRKHNIEYRNLIPTSLEKFVEQH